MNTIKMLHSRINGFCFAVWTPEGKFVEQSQFFASGEECALAQINYVAKQSAAEDVESTINFYMSL